MMDLIYGEPIYYRGRRVSPRAAARLKRWHFRAQLKADAKKFEGLTLNIQIPFARSWWHYLARCFLSGHGVSLLGRCTDCGRRIS